MIKEKSNIEKRTYEEVFQSECELMRLHSEVYGEITRNCDKLTDWLKKNGEHFTYERGMAIKEFARDFELIAVNIGQMIVDSRIADLTAKERFREDVRERDFKLD